MKGEGNGYEAVELARGSSMTRLFCAIIPEPVIAYGSFGSSVGSRTIGFAGSS